MFLQVVERAGKILERWPIRDRLAVGDALFVGRVDAPLRRGACKRSAADRDIAWRGAALLGSTRDAHALRDSSRVSGRRARSASSLQRLNHSAFPIDQGAVAIESERVEIRQQRCEFS